VKCIHQTVSEADASSYGLRVLESRFSFNENMYKYLNEVHGHIWGLFFFQLRRDKESDAETRASYEKSRQVHLIWIMRQGFDDEVWIEQWRPFLEYVAPTHPWVLRWP
jgi:hypothetical protein